MLGSDTGLKIPNSAITKKEFFTIPKEYFTASGDSDDSSLMVKDKSSGSVNIVSPTIFSQNDEFYFVDDEYLKDGDIIVNPIPHQPTGLEPIRTSSQVSTISTKDTLCLSR